MVLDATWFVRVKMVQSNKGNVSQMFRFSKYDRTKRSKRALMEVFQAMEYVFYECGTFFVFSHM